MRSPLSRASRRSAARPRRVRDTRPMGGGTRTHALPPGPASPGTWQLLRCQADFAGYLDACVRRHGPLFTLRMPPFDAFVAATEPDDVETILLDTTTRFEEGAASAILEPLVGRASLILSSGPQHMRQRKTLLPAFHGGLAERWEQPIAEIAERHLARLPLETPIALREPVREIALDAICRILFGATTRRRTASCATRSPAGSTLASSCCCGSRRCGDGTAASTRPGRTSAAARTSTSSSTRRSRDGAPIRPRRARRRAVRARRRARRARRAADRRRGARPAARPADGRPSRRPPTRSRGRSSASRARRMPAGAWHRSWPTAARSTSTRSSPRRCARARR